MRSKDINVLTLIALGIEQYGRPPQKVEVSKEAGLSEDVTRRIFAMLQIKGYIVGMEYGTTANVAVTAKGHTVVRDHIEQIMNRWSPSW